MTEAPIARSPHAVDPFRELSEEERKERYRTRIDSTIKPYSVIDVLTKVFHRSFADDLLSHIGKFPEKYKSSSDEWQVSRSWVNNLNVVRVESIFFQAPEDYKVDIVVDARIRLEEERTGFAALKTRHDFNSQLRLRYSFDLRVCKMICRFDTVIFNEEDSLIANDPYGIPSDKYLIPVLKGKKYDILAQFVIYKFMPDYLDMDGPVDPMVWARNYHAKVLYGDFGISGVLGEYFFDFGMANIVDELTGKAEPTEIDIGTVVLNRNLKNSGGSKNTTLFHELFHKYLDTPFFLLQKMHGHDYCSYMCKRFDEEAAKRDYWTPIDIMEMHANKMPGYMSIQTRPGRAYAEKLLEEFGGQRDIATMRKMVDAMAEHFETTKTVAKTRLIDFGYNEVRGIAATANGNLVPAYMSTLSETETYTVDEKDAIQEYIRNRAFREAINSGCFLYVEGHYCLNDSKYLFTDQYGFQHLTQYARENMQECCLVFIRNYQKSGLKVLGGLIQKGKPRGSVEVRFKEIDWSKEATAEGRETLKAIMRKKAEHDMLVKSFNQLTVDLMDSHRMDIGDLVEATGLSRETIKNLRNDGSRNFRIQEVVAVAIAMHLEPTISRLYIESAPCGFANTDEMFVYQYALNEWYMLPLAVVNRKIVEMGKRPLTNLIVGYDEKGRKMDKVG